MSKRFLIGVVGACTVLALGSFAWSQDAKPGAKPEAKPEKKLDEPKPEAKGDKKPETSGGMDMSAMMPGENHKLLEGMVGDWTTSVKMWMDPSQPPTESAGTTKNTSLYEGRYIQSEHNGKMQFPGPDGKMIDMPFKGMSLTGYDNVKKKFFDTWIDNMGTGIMVAEGTYDAATKTFSFDGGEVDCGMGPSKTRHTIKVVDKDNHVFEMYQTPKGGKEFRCLEIKYTRKK